MRRRTPAANLPVGMAVAVAMTLGIATGCGGGGSKPSAAVAGCDLSPVSDPGLPVKYMISLELHNEHLVTGDARLHGLVVQGLCRQPLAGGPPRLPPNRGADIRHAMTRGTTWVTSSR